MIRPIRTAKDHTKALARLDELWDAKRGTPERDEFEILGVLVDAYESEHHPIVPPDPVDAILFRMEQGAFTRKDLETLLGGRPRVSELLNRKRELSMRMIRALVKAYDFPAEVLIREPASKSRKTRVATSKAKGRASKSSTATAASRRASRDEGREHPG